ncbi:MAG: hypothetical protein J6Y20_07320 [Lachnospiraceae bacterium]|nr:hypothetical protein [Lachnospiraceae bacterium]
MGNSRGTKVRIEMADDNFGCVLICAIRYSLGRRTYMPGLVTDWIMNHCAGKLTEKTLGMIVQAIEEHGKHCSYGDECDVHTWKRFRVWARNEIADRTMGQGNEHGNGN